MAGPLINWLRGEPAVPPSPALTEAIASLKRLAQSRPELVSSAAVLEKLLPVAFASTESQAAALADRDGLLEGWRNGIPAFRTWSPKLDESQIRDRAGAVARALRGENQAAQSLVDAIEKGRIDPAGALARIIQAGPDAISELAEPAGVAPDLLAAVLRLAVLPRLERLSVALNPLRPEGVWTRGECPHCGIWPWMAESRGIDQRRFLRCAWCAADWPVDRLKCFACGQGDHRLLRNWSVTGEEARCRLVTCAACGARLRVVSTLSPLSAPALIVAELETIHFDLVSAEPSG